MHTRHPIRARQLFLAAPPVLTALLRAVLQHHKNLADLLPEGLGRIVYQQLPAGSYYNWSVMRARLSSVIFRILAVEASTSSSSV